ncbi:MAG TPA: succinyl-diaminopimelate desuccinylase [Acidimicrobiales bacterium]|nr:succinyl-diaminopimelate desuccinylase [Acidimicrobiales bacterium]
MSDLLAATAELVAVPSLSTEEGLIADHVESLLRRHAWLDVVRVGDNVVARTGLGLPDRVVLAGHLDTVPPNGNAVPKIDGTSLWGLGSTDMKGGLAVMLDLAGTLGRPNCDVTYVFYVAEEIAREHNGLLALASAEPGLIDASAAIVCEPTNCRVEAGCQGVLKADIAIAGRRAHVARPWTGRNAIHRLAPLLAGLAGWPGREVQIDGCTYTESLQAVGVSGGVASNVLPDHAVLQLNYRFAPDRDAAAAGEALKEIVAPWLEVGDSFTVADSAPSAPPSLNHPLLARLVSAASGPVSGKLGWTDVAFFAERGIPAANFGPGDPELAHTAGEMVTRGSLEEARQVLGRLLGE